jgi:outer membrane protein assembly factor BamB
MYSLNETTGGLNWAKEFQLPMSSSPAYNNGRLFVGSNEGVVYCLDARTGLTIWLSKTNDVIVSSAAIADNKIFIGSEDNNIYSIDEKTGAIDWKYQTDGMIKSSPAIVNGRLYIGSDDGFLYCLGKNSSTFSIQEYMPPLAIVAIALATSITLFLLWKKRNAKSINKSQLTFFPT